jgi:hypothetical protein
LELKSRAIIFAYTLSVLTALVGSDQASARNFSPIVAAREHQVSLRRNAIVAFPLYDGKLTVISAPGLRDLGPAYLHSKPMVSIGGIVRSNRAEMFAVIGHPGETGVVTVVLRLPQLGERCVSCRTVHYFYAIH